MFCPVCGDEYRAGITRCTDLQVLREDEATARELLAASPTPDGGNGDA